MTNLHICLNSFTNESRVLKEVNSILKYNFFQSVHIAALHDDGLDEYRALDDRRFLYRFRLKSRSLPRLLPFQLLKFGEFFFRVIILARRIRPRLINIHTLALLPLGILLKFLCSSKLIYDAHELETEVEGLHGLRQRLARLAERIFIRYCDAVLVVNHSISTWYKEKYALPKVWVMYNMPSLLSGAAVRKGLLRSELGLSDVDDFLYIYQGNLSSGRGIELIIDAFSGLGDKYHVVFMGYGPLDELVKQAACDYSNVHFWPAVAPGLVQEYTVDADVGLSLIENTCLSYYLCAPNKIFEYISCGVVPIVSYFPEMSKFVVSSDCGWVVKPDSIQLRKLIMNISKDSLFNKRENALRMRSKYCWENEELVLVTMLQDLGFSEGK